MGVIIEESEMQFGEYDMTQVFHMEDSEQYVKKLKPNGIKSCEFVLLKGKKCILWRQRNLARIECKGNHRKKSEKK